LAGLCFDDRNSVVALFYEDKDAGCDYYWDSFGVGVLISDFSHNIFNNQKLCLH